MGLCVVSIDGGRCESGFNGGAVLQKLAAFPQTGRAGPNDDVAAMWRGGV